MGAGHAHDPAHAGAGHAHTDFSRAFLIGTLLNLGFVVVEAGYGIASGSIALIADAGHNLSDVGGLAVAWGAATLARRPPSARYTYGLRRASILAALFNALFLLVATGAIAFAAIRRLADPAPVQGGIVMAVAAVGIVVNGVTAAMFARGQGDINIRGAYLHMAADAAVSAGVVAAGLIILKTGWRWVDPAISLTIVAVILWSSWGLLRDAVVMSLDGVPAGIDPAAVGDALGRLPGVARVHDMRIWPVSTTEAALTCRLLVPTHSGEAMAGGDMAGDAFLRDAAAMLSDRFGIAHATLQIETGNAPAGD